MAMPHSGRRKRLDPRRWAEAALMLAEGTPPALVARLLRIPARTLRHRVRLLCQARSRDLYP